MNFKSITPKHLAFITGATFAGFLFESAEHVRETGKTRAQKKLADQIDEVASACEATADQAAVKAALATVSELRKADDSLAVVQTVCQHMADAFDAMARKDRTAASNSVRLAMETAYEPVECAPLTEDDIAGAYALLEVENGATVH